eukprot:Blabericola_migrator_1__11270@NODE_663_length_6971_cov_273_239426_g484_i0_p2_GENE_NODE_663_length_6971_cov_273_239426_g484_i0NODE_663_length_6971_cov_273_239426_g484_i0_p2_ORF_typecomplete_len650_score98_47Lipase_3/PF01764_25/2_7e03Lipase_3/PF01764_25/2_2e19DUF2974/PF11187_8/8_6e07Esterase/PF00756_20/0_0023Lipase/PF00151_19/0_035Abhydrolase_6/PF12697_7/5_7e03Abhydrolase_6/PF12697_7/0_096PGAP1/PF07819_13/0_18PEPPE/PF08237_11/0_28_NODE_663_length_6971_cov_273_239426_g484_i030755024
MIKSKIKTTPTMKFQSLWSVLLPWSSEPSPPKTLSPGLLSLQSERRVTEIPNTNRPLYTFRQRQIGEVRTTTFFTATAHAFFIDSVGHPWCFEGFGDAFTMAITQLLKSELSLMLTNTAAGLDTNRSEMLWDPETRSFVIANDDAQFAPGYTDYGNKIAFPFDVPQNSATWPIIAGILSKVFDDTNLGDKLRSITDMLCQLSDAEAAAQPFQDNVYFCFMEDLVGALLICGESEQSANCASALSEYARTTEDFPNKACYVNPESPYASHLAPSIFFHDQSLELPILFVDLLKPTLPSKIPEEVMTKEALTYLALFRSLMISTAFSRRPFLCGAEKFNPPLLLPGWSLPFVITLKQEGDPIFKEDGLARDSIPLVFVSQSRANQCNFVIGVRGTASMFEWTQDFDYFQVPFPLNNQVQAHGGFTNLLNVVAPILDAFIQKQTHVNGCGCSDTSITVTGHSLGAGVAQLIALYMAEKYGKYACGLQVSGAFFAPPRIFNSYGANRSADLVNGRVLLDIGDGLSYMPCYEGNAKSGWARCTRGHMTRPGVGRDLYAENYGIAEIDVDFSTKSGGKGIDALMQTLFPSGDRRRPSFVGSLLSKVLEVTIPSLNAVPSLGVLGAAHICAFACRFSQLACGSQFQWWCEGCPMLI